MSQCEICETEIPDGESKEESVDPRELISKVEQIFKEALVKLGGLK